MSRYNVSRYGYDYSLTPARPTGWRGTVANITIFSTVMAVSAISGVVVTLDLFGSSTPPAIVAPVTAAVPAAPQAAAHPTMQRIAQVFALVTSPTTAPKAAAQTAPKAAPMAAPTSAPATASTVADHAAPLATVAAAPAVTPPPAPPAVAAQVPQPQPTPVADSDLTFAKGYAQRQAVAHGAPIKHGKVVIEAKAQLGRGALKAKPKVYARNTNTNTNTPADQRRTAIAQRPDAYGMFQHFERPDQFDFAHHQALAFGEQRTSRRNEQPRPPAPPYGNSPNGMFGGLF